MNEKKATTRPPERRGVPKSQIRDERRQRAERKKKIRQSIIVSGISVFAILVIASLVVPGLIRTWTTTNNSLRIRVYFRRRIVF